MIAILLYLFSALLQEHQTDANKDLSCIVKNNIQNPEALTELFAEGVYDKNNITYKEKNCSKGKYDRERRGKCHKIAHGYSVHEHDGSDINNSEYLERQLGSDVLKQPQDKEQRQNNADSYADLPVDRHLENGYKIHNVSGQKNKDTDQKSKLTSLLEDESEIQQNICDKSQDQATDKESGNIPSGAVKNSDQDKTKRSKSFPDICPYIALFHLSSKKNRCEYCT